MTGSRVFEFDKYEAGRSGIRSSPSEDYDPFKGGRRRALLLWAEHCIECAAPQCFSTCDLYDARPDERCRRFEYGIFKNRKYVSANGYGAEVVFKRWGKLEARGNALMLPSRLVGALETLIEWSLPAANSIGRVIRRLRSDIRWSYLSFATLERLNSFLHSLWKGKYLPDAFVAEIYNPSQRIVELTLLMTVQRTGKLSRLRPDQLPRPMMRHLSVQPGYNRFDIEASAFHVILGSGLPFGIALTPGADDGAHLVFISLDFVQYDKKKGATEAAQLPKAEIATSPAAKCVIFDLDQTIWDGVLLEGEVALKEGVAELFAELDSRGVLLSVCSKNDHQHAMEQLRRFDLEKYLLFPKINWARKSRNISDIAKQLSLGLDSFIFVDDNPFEREEVRKVHPEVEVLPETALVELRSHSRLQGSKTEESGRRRLMYREAMEREEVALTFGEDYIAFLRESQIVMEIMPVTEQHVERVVELVQRTNQLNFSGRKYARDEIMRIIEGDELDQHVISCRDKFGSYGVVGFALSRRSGSTVVVEDFMLSCRVQGKFLEQALFYHLVFSTDPPAAELEVNFKSTDRNALAKAVMTELGLTAYGEAGRLRRKIAPGDFAVDFITVNVH